MKRKVMLLALVLTLALAWIACDQAKTAKTTDEGKVLATVNGIKITDQQLLQMIQGLLRNPSQAQMFQDMEGKKMLVNKVIDLEVVAAAGKREGLERDPEVRRLIDTYTKQVLFIAYLQKKMKEKQAEVTEEQARKYYDEHPDEFNAPESAKISQILIKVAADADAATTAEAEKKAKAALAKVKAGADFAKVAQEFSDDAGTRERGGDLGFVPQGRMDPALDEVAFKLEIGQVSDVIKTARGFHILKVVEKKPAGKRTFEEVKMMVMTRLRMQGQQDAYDSIIEPLKKTAKINIDEKALEQFTVPMPSMQNTPGMQGMPAGIQNAQPASPGN